MDARSHGHVFFPCYNTEHRHTALGLLTPHDVHYGLADARVAARAETLAAAHAVHPERFPRGVPHPPARPTAVWINPPATRGLFVIDEIGYLSYDARAADLLFQVVSRRYERRSLVLTTNLPFSEWPTIFPNAATATALIDRVVHHAEIITIEGESYRRRVAETTQKSSRASK